MRSFKLGNAGMRGVVGSGLTVERAIDFASAFGTMVDGGRVLVGQDTRSSSNMLYHAVVSALMGAGCRVCDAGIMPAGVIQFLIPRLEASGGLLIGGGHQAMGWNAAIPLASNGSYLNFIQLQELFDIYRSRQYRQAPWNGIQALEQIPDDSIDAYLDALCKTVNVKAIKKAGFTVVADFCNGSGSILADRLAARLGLKMIAINRIFSGVLPHEPEPRPRSAAQVQSVVGPLNAAAGFVFNSDVSRVSLVSDSGEALSEEYTAPLAVDYLLAKKPDTRVVTNICSSRSLDDVVARHGGELYKTRVGQAWAIDRMTELGARIACEGSGSLTTDAWIRGFDGFYVMALVLEYMAVSGKKLSELATEIPRYHIVKSSVRCQPSHAYTLIRNIARELKNEPKVSVIEEDGIRLDWEDGWISLRAASTESVIRMTSEARTREIAIDREFHMRGLIEKQVGGGA
jgi:phosphomannomutase